MLSQRNKKGDWKRKKKKRATEEAVRYSNLEFQGEDRTENQLLGVVCIDSVFKAMGLDEIKGGSVDRKLKD